MISVACRVLEVTVLAWNNITQAAPWVMGDSGKHYLDMLVASPRGYASSCSQKTGPACRGGSRQCACRGAGLGWVGLGAWACGPGRAGRWGGRNGVPHLRNGHLALRAPCYWHWHSLEHMRPASPLVASLGGLNAVFFNTPAVPCL
jgi:hypothetical protein